MEAYFFGPPDRQLFGAYSPPLSAWPKPVGALICPPIGQEYMRSHRGLHSLANALARDGLHVLRFDYFGTGDSAGTTDEIDWNGCLDDVAAATEELIEISGATEVVLVGMRLGATLAAQYAATNPRITRLILWDPIVRGADYLEDMERISRVMLADFDRFPRPRRARSDRQANELVGFELSDQLQSQIRALDLGAAPQPTQSTQLVLSPSVQRQPSVSEWLDGSAAAPIQADEAYWADHALVEVAYLPSSTIPKVVTAVSG